MSFRTVSKQFIVESGLNGGKHHDLLLLHGHASPVTIDFLKYDKDNNIHLFQLPSHLSHMTQPLDDCAFGVFKCQITETLTVSKGKRWMQIRSSE